MMKTTHQKVFFPLEADFLSNLTQKTLIFEVPLLKKSRTNPKNERKVLLSFYEDFMILSKVFSFYSN